MKSLPNAQATVRTKPVKALTQVLGQTEEVKGLVDEAAQELSSVNAVLKQELEDRKALPGVEETLEKSEAVEDKVQEAADKLAVVKAALKEEVRERHVLDIQLAAVIEREEASRHAAFHDSLTSLPNRALFIDRLEHGLAQARRHGWKLAVMFLDLDGFKKINDTHGHDAGDQVLKSIATRLTEITRDDDTVSRHGGDEFIYLLTEVKGERELTAIAEKILAAIQQPCDVGAGESAFAANVSASVGIAVFPKDGDTAQALIARADKAMYRAKASKSGYAFAE